MNGIFDAIFREKLSFPQNIAPKRRLSAENPLEPGVAETFAGGPSLSTFSPVVLCSFWETIRGARGGLSWASEQCCLWGFWRVFWPWEFRRRRRARRRRTFPSIFGSKKRWPPMPPPQAWWRPTPREPNGGTRNSTSSTSSWGKNSAPKRSKPSGPLSVSGSSTATRRSPQPRPWGASSRRSTAGAPSGA